MNCTAVISHGLCGVLPVQPHGDGRFGASASAGLLLAARHGAVAQLCGGQGLLPGTAATRIRLAAAASVSDVLPSPNGSRAAYGVVESDSQPGLPGPEHRDLDFLGRCGDHGCAQSAALRPADQ